MSTQRRPIAHSSIARAARQASRVVSTVGLVALAGCASYDPSYVTSYWFYGRPPESHLRPGADIYRVQLTPREVRRFATGAAARYDAEQLTDDALIELWDDYALDAAVAQLRRDGRCLGPASMKGRPQKRDRSGSLEVTVHCPAK